MLITVSKTSLEKSELLERLRQLKLELIEVPYWISGTVIETKRKQSKTRNPFYYLSQSIKGKTKRTYISERHLEAFKQVIVEVEQLKEILTEINRINILLLKSEGTNVTKYEIAKVIGKA